MITSASLVRARDELRASVASILAFWMERAPDRDFGGFFTNIGGDGSKKDGSHDKYLNTQARLIWCFSELGNGLEGSANRAALDAARDGAIFLRDHFVDVDHGGWYWKVDRSGRTIDAGKLTYGHCFALYGLATFARRTGDKWAVVMATDTFDAIQVKMADNRRGGYYENLERDWRPSRPGQAGGDRKTLDIHLHVLEAFAALVRLTDDAVHRQRLRDVRDLILDRMVDTTTGAGGNQYSLDFEPLPPIAIDRTWIAERPGHECNDSPKGMTTSYGHNLELAWLLGDADRTLGEAGTSDPVIERLACHAFRFGRDHARGGVYREGPLDGNAFDRDKEFWQNSEALVGWLEAHRATGDERYLEAFLADWDFARRYFVHPEFGEWRVRVAEDGKPLIDDLGNDWKVGYHTGRAARECVRRLDDLLAKEY